MFNEEEKTLKEHDLSQELKIIEKYLNSRDGEAIGFHRRLVITRSLADFFLILFSLFDFILLKKIYGIRPLKYFFWLCQ